MTDENGGNKRQRIGGENEEMKRGWGTKCKQKTEGTGVDPSNTWKVDRFHKNRWYLKSTKSRSNNSFTFCFRSHCIYSLSLSLSIESTLKINLYSIDDLSIHFVVWPNTLSIPMSAPHSSSSPVFSISVSQYVKWRFWMKSSYPKTRLKFASSPCSPKRSSICKKVSLHSLQVVSNEWNETR